MKLKKLDPEEWREIYFAAERFRKESPWDDINDNELFSVVNPKTGEEGYCSILGMYEDVFALKVYLGSEALHRFKLMPEYGDIDIFGWHSLECQKCLVASFEDKNELNKNEIDVIKKLGIHCNSDDWPLFYRNNPAERPRDLNEDEREFLTIALQQSIEVIKKYRNYPSLLDNKKSEGASERYFTRILEGSQWKDCWKVPEKYHKKTASNTDKALLDRLKSADFPKKGVWFSEFILIPAIMKPKEMRVPYLFSVLTKSEDFCLGLEKLFTPEEELTDAFLKICHEHRRIPTTIVVGSERTQSLFEPTTKELGIRLKIQHSELLIEFFNDILMQVQMLPEEMPDQLLIEALEKNNLNINYVTIKQVELKKLIINSRVF